MAMDPLDIEIVDIEDEEESPKQGWFKRLMAFAAAVVALFGAVVVLLASHASVDSAKASRDAQLAASSGVGSEIRGDTRSLVAFGTYAQAQEYRRRRTLALAEARRHPGTDVSAIALEEAGIWAEVAGSLEPLTPLLSDPAYVQEADPTFPLGLYTDNAVNANVDDLRRQAKQELSNAWSGKAGQYGSVVTLLAVVLFLMSLSLTVEGGLRFAVLVPAVAIGVACGAITIGAALRPVSPVPDDAVRAVAEGDRLLGRYEFSSAVDEYTKAIDLQPRYALAYGRRASARFAEGGDPRPGQQITAYAPPEFIDAAVIDARKAIDLGADDVGSVNILGALLFHQREYQASVEVFEHALELNADNPIAWSNLGTAQLALGDVEASADAFRHGVDSINARPYVGERAQLYGASLTVLEIILEREPDRSGDVRRIEDQLVNAQIVKEVGDVSESSVEVTDLSIEFSSSGVWAEFNAPDLSPDTPVGVIWFTRPNKDRPFQVEASMAHIRRAGEHIGDSLRYFSLPGGCAEPGDYRVDVYIGGRRAATTTANRRPGSLGRMTYATFDDALAALVCQPEGWERTTDPGALLTLREPDGDNEVTIEAVAVAALADSSEELLARLALTQVLGDVAAATTAEPFELGGVSGLALTDPDDVERILFAGVIGPDEVRVVTITGEKGVELAATLTFYTPV